MTVAQITDRVHGRTGFSCSVEPMADRRVMSGFKSWAAANRLVTESLTPVES